MPDTSNSADAATAAANGLLTYPYKLPTLGYSEGALSAAISPETLTTHYGKHHKAYVDNLNTALKDYPDLQRLTLQELLVQLTLVPDAIRETVRNNGGGHANHTMYWAIMAAPDDSRAPKDAFADALNQSFGDLDSLKETFNAAGKKLFGSGWVFVTVDENGALTLETAPNQDTPLMKNRAVLFGNDVWEHAYYLTYKNARVDYLADWWKVVNWDAIGSRYDRIVKGNIII